jgi:hypothetical protein
LIAPLDNQLAPKSGQDGKLLEQGKEPFAWLPSDKFKVGESLASSLFLGVDCSQSQAVTPSFELKRGARDLLENPLQVLF